MSIELTPEQRQVVRQSEAPVRLVDPDTSTPYVLLREDVYRRIQALLGDGPLTDEERKAIVAGVWKRARWDNPAMDEYARLLPRP
jgi:hypothetical protein